MCVPPGPGEDHPPGGGPSVRVGGPPRVDHHPPGRHAQLPPAGRERGGAAELAARDLRRAGRFCAARDARLRSAVAVFRESAYLIWYVVIFLLFIHPAAIRM